MNKEQLKKLKAEGWRAACPKRLFRGNANLSAQTMTKHGASGRQQDASGIGGVTL